MSGIHLVVGASGFLGSHVAQELVARGEEVRVLVRPTSDVRGIQGVDVDVRHGDIFDLASIRDALVGVDVVYYCVVDARPWLRDPGRLHRTNVEGLRGVLDVVLEHDLRRFVYTSSVATLPIAEHAGQVVDEDSGPHNWLEKGGAYVRSRVDGENLVLSYARDRGLPAVAMCVGNTYGAADLLPTPHGALLRDAARGKLPWYVPGAGGEIVCIRDAARALVLAGEHGRIGERYVIAERYMSTREVHDLAAATTGKPAARHPVPAGLLSAGGLMGEVVARIRRRDIRLTRTSVRLMHIMTPLDHSKAVRELGWTPRPATEAVREAAIYFTQGPRAGSNSTSNHQASGC